MKLPEVMLQNQKQMRGVRQYRLTKHGRQRFIARTGLCDVSDSVIVMLCVNDPRAVWKPDSKHPNVLRLVTYLSSPRKE